MLSNRLAFAGLAVACVVAAGTGGYLASRSNAVQEASGAAVEAAAPPPAVKETEAIVAEAQTPPAPAGTAEEPRPAPRRTEAPPRPAPSRRTEPPRSARTAPAPPPLERAWPSSANAPEPPADAPPALPVESSPVREIVPPSEPVRPPEPPEAVAEELVIAANSVVGLKLESSVSSERAKVEDRVEAHVARDVRVDGKVAIPAGTRALGSVMLVEQGGRFKERARLGIRFHTLVLADGTRLPITTETINRYGDAPGNSSAAKIGGGAVAGAILGAILGGAKGAAVGATAGAGGGTAAVMASDRSEATFPAGTELTARIISPVSVIVEK